MLSDGRDGRRRRVVVATAQAAALAGPLPASKATVHGPEGLLDPLAELEGAGG